MPKSRSCEERDGRGFKPLLEHLFSFSFFFFFFFFSFFSILFSLHLVLSWSPSCSKMSGSSVFVSLVISMHARTSLHSAAAELYPFRTRCLQVRSRVFYCIRHYHLYAKKKRYDTASTSDYLKQFHPQNFQTR